MNHLIAKCIDGLEVNECFQAMQMIGSVAKEKNVGIIFVEGHAIHFSGKLEGSFLLPEGRETCFEVGEGHVDVRGKETANLIVSSIDGNMVLNTRLGEVADFSLMENGQFHSRGLCVQF